MAETEVYTFFSTIENPDPEEPTQCVVDSFEWGYIDEEEDTDTYEEDEDEDEEEDS